jgi:radical SAM superfamily enzyme YgiQ (UPF0313 family)
MVSFVDDVFTYSRSWLEEFIEKYKSIINIPFFCSAHPLTITREMALLLKEGGCCLTTMGIQSGSERIRKEVFKRQISNDRIIESISYIKEAGIKLSVDNIFGAPSENEDDLKDGFNLYQKAKTDRILTFWLTYYPQTSIIDYAKDLNCLSEEDVENIEEGYTGFTHDTGSVSKEKAKVYYKYEILFQLCSLVHNDKSLALLSKIAVLIPLKKLTTRVIILMNAIKNMDFKFFYLVKYMWSQKNTP